MKLLSLRRKIKGYVSLTFSVFGNTVRTINTEKMTKSVEWNKMEHKKSISSKITEFFFFARIRNQIYTSAKCFTFSCELNRKY